MPTARASLAAALAALALAAGAARAADLGTLFHTPEERERLDALRQGEAGSPEARGARAITGYVKRSDGRATVWIDGVPVQVPASQSGLLKREAVRAYAERPGAVKVERKPPR